VRDAGNICCSVLQCVAVCCGVMSVLQCDVLCFSVLQYVAVCCNTLQCVAAERENERDPAS